MRSTDDGGMGGKSMGLPGAGLALGLAGVGDGIWPGMRQAVDVERSERP
jgi:hypothetical protein